ncbi:MAG: hypothetical protein LBG74_04835 [Spirochaetaceae bacterium]|nr:hypothetical protein [Spirochaetaceae bacterium]
MNSKRILNAFVSNWPVKALSLAGALFLFFFHRANTLDSRTLSVALRVENAGNMIPVNNYPKTIRITFRGERKFMDSITENDIDAFLDLLYCNTPGSYTLPVGIVKKGNALDADPLEIMCDPQEIRVDLDEAASKMIPVQAVISGAVPANYELVSTRVAPAVVMVNGPESMLIKTESLSTEPVKIDNRTETFVMTLRIINNEPLLELLGNKTVEFTAEIQPAVSGKRFELPVQVHNLNAAWKAQSKSSHAEVFVQADSPSALSTLNAEMLTLFVNAAGINKEGEYQLPLDVELVLPQLPDETPEANAIDETDAKTLAETVDSPSQQDARKILGGYTVVKISPDYIDIQITKAE